MGGQVSQLFSYRFTFVITRRVAARRMSKINGSHLELFPRTFAFFSPRTLALSHVASLARCPSLSLSLYLSFSLSNSLDSRLFISLSFSFSSRYRYTAGIYN